MKTLNLQYRGLDRTTDVLSFPLLSPGELQQAGAQALSNHSQPLGDIVISLQKAQRQAEDYGVTLYEEVKRLLIHGLLHLMGYDHEQSLSLRRMMEKKERELRMIPI